MLPTQSEEAPASVADIEGLAKVLQAYDEAWLVGEISKLAQLFSEEFPCLADLRQEATQFLEKNRVVQCRSQASTTVRSGGNLGAYVDTTLNYLPRKEGGDGPGFQRILVLSHFLLLAPEKRGLRILRMEEYDREMRNALRIDRIGCPACNFELSRPKGWFLVPRGRGWSPCTDSFSLIHPSGKINADFDILEALRPVDPKQVLEQDNQHLTQACGTRPEKITILSSRSFQIREEHRAEEVEGAIVQECGTGPVQTHFLRTYISRGSILYSLNIYGEESAFRKHRAEADAIKASFRITNPSIPLGSLRQMMKARHNPGGTLEQNNYVNQQYGVRLQGPTGWNAEDFSGPTLFRVSFSCPKDSGLSLNFHAIENPNGWPDEDSIREVIESTEKTFTRAYSASAKRVESRRWAHRGLQAFCYEVDWQLPGENPLRERSAFLPAGCILYVLEYCAPAELFEQNLGAYKSALDSLSRF